GGGYLAGPLQRDTPRRARCEDEADGGSPELARERDILRTRQSADLDPGHGCLSSRNISSGSSERRRASPTRNASKPADARRRTSSRERMPLSASRTGPRGIAAA